MSSIHTKAELYQAAEQIREGLKLPEFYRSEEVFQRIAQREESILSLVPFHSTGLQGMASIGEPGERDVILLSAHLDERERGFYAAHELVHLTCHRTEKKGAFRCFSSNVPMQD